MTKIVFAQSSVYKNKAVSRNISQLTLGEVPCFHKMKIVHNTVSKMNGLYLELVNNLSISLKITFTRFKISPYFS